MTRLAILDDPAFELSLIDAPGNTPSGTPNYTFDTLDRLRQSLPPNTTLFLLIGADSLKTVQLTHANYFDGSVAVSKYLEGVNP